MSTEPIGERVVIGVAGSSPQDWPVYTVTGVLPRGRVRLRYLTRSGRVRERTTYAAWCVRVSDPPSTTREEMSEE
jgi:hypothetical protein